MMKNRLLIFSGNSVSDLAQKVCGFAGLELGQMLVGRFSDGEVRVEIQQSVRGWTCLCCSPPARR